MFGFIPADKVEIFQSTPSSQRETEPRKTYAPFSTFQSTPSSQRETENLEWGAYSRKISIHALLAEGDVIRNIAEYDRINISIHSLLAEGDLIQAPLLLRHRNFNPLPPRRGRRNKPVCNGIHTKFQSTPSSQRETTHIF